MGFRSGSYATVWQVDPVSDKQTRARISISRKNKQTGEYETDFSNYVSFFGTLTAKQAAALKERDRIRLGDVDVHTKYDREKGVTYYNFNVYSFEHQGGVSGDISSTHSLDPQPIVDIADDIEDELLPF